jgi:hypothetical protein
MACIVSWDKNGSVYMKLYIFRTDYKSIFLTFIDCDDLSIFKQRKINK